VKIAIMQPYFFPYVGYFQLIAAVDVFVVYDNIKYVKSGWINRNRILCNGAAVPFSLPLKGASDQLDVREREIAVDYRPDKLLNQVRGAYGAAPHFGEAFSLIERILRFPSHNLFEFLNHAIRAVCERLGIDTEIKISSSVPIDHGLKKQEKVIALCRALRTDTYVNAIGGEELYSREDFRNAGFELKFVRSGPFEYRQLGAAFVPLLSIIDALMFNPLARVRECVFQNYELI
jgi:hypothetical protein